MKFPFTLRTKRIIYYLLVFFSCSTQIFAQGNPAELGNYFIKNFSRDYLNGRGTNWDIEQDKNGLILIGNLNNGIALYDGQRVKKIEMNGLPYLEEARDIKVDSKGQLHVASFFDFGDLQKDLSGKYNYQSLSQKLPDSLKPKSRVWNVAVFTDTVYYQADSMIYRYKDGKLLKTWRFQNPVHVMHEVGNRLFLRNWGIGLLELKKDVFQFVKGSEFLANTRVEAMYPLQNGDILLGSRQIGFWLMKPNGSFVKPNVPKLDQLIIDGEIYLANTTLKNGLIPIVTNNYGLLLIDQNLNLIKIINTSVGLGSDYVSSVFEDRNHDIWVSGSGAAMISMDPTITYFSKVNGIKGSVGNIKRYNGKLYVKTSEDLYELIPPKDNFSKVEFRAQGVNEAGNDLESFGDQLITTNNYNIKWSKNGKTGIIKTQYYTQKSHQSKLNSKLLFSGSIGLILHEYTNGKWKEIPVKNNLKIALSYFIEPVPGKLIFNTPEGIYQYKYDQSGQGEFTPVRRDKDFVKSKLHFIMKTDASTYYFLDSSFHGFAIDLEKQKLIYQGWSLDTLVLDDRFAYTYNSDAGYGWVRTMKGLFQVKITKGQKPIIKKYPFEKVNLSELSAGMLAEGIGENEVLWLASQDEKMYRYLPAKALTQKNIAYKALITGVYQADSLIALENQKISFDQNALTFEVAYPLFGNEEKIKFSFWLEGQDDAWTSFSRDSKKEYTNLHEGKYTLHVKAMDASGKMSEEASISFIILPPWYRTWWAYLLYLSLLGFAIFLFGKWQAKRSLDQAENERRINELKAARDFQQSMLPKKMPIREDLEFATFLRSSTEVGGDYYDFFEQRNGDLYVVCGDATGHGTISGMMVSITKAGLNGISAIAPNEILRQLNRVIKRVDLGTMRMSLNMLFLTQDKVVMSSAAMPPIYRYDAQTRQVEEILISGLPLGGLRKEEFDLVERPLHVGDVYVLLSDGLPEAPNKEGELFNYHQVAALIQQNGHLSAQDIQDALVKNVDEWLEGKQNPDDITIIVIKKK